MEREAGLPTRQSGFGAASFVCSLLGILGICLIFGGSLFLHPGRADDTLYWQAIVVLLFVTAANFIAGIMLGIAGLLQKSRRKGPALAGLVLAVASLIGLALYLLAPVDGPIP